MPRNVSKALKRLSKWRADTCQALSRAACGDSLADTVRVILQKTANIFKTIKDDAFDEEQRGQLSRELLNVLLQVSSNLHFRARDLLLAVESVVSTRFAYWNNQCALLSYILDLALALNEPSAISKVLFILSKSKHRVWDVLVQTEAIASTAALGERDRVFDIFRWLATYCPRTCSNPELYFKFIACAACLARRLHERGWKIVKPTALTIEPAEFDFEEWFAAQPALVVLLPPSADPRPRRKVVAQLCKSASSHAELLKACEAISESGGGPWSNIRSACSAEATTEDDFFTIVDDGLEARKQTTTTPQVADQQLLVLESTLSRIHSSLSSPCINDSVNSDLISEASISPLHTQAFLDKLLSGTSAGKSMSTASDGMQKPGKRLDYMDKKLLEEANGLNGRAADKGDRSKGSTQEEAPSEDESFADATADPVHSSQEITKRNRKKEVLQHKASQGEMASSLAETVPECGMSSAITVGIEEGESPSFQLSTQKHIDTASSVSAAENVDSFILRHDKRTPLKRAKRYSSTDDSSEKELCGQEIAKINGKLPPLQKCREAPQPSSSLQVRPVTEKVKAASVQHSSSCAVGKLSLAESKGKLKVQSDSESKAVAQAVANRRSRACRARTKVEECCVIDSSEEEAHREECLEESSGHSLSDDGSEGPLSLGVEKEDEGSCSGLESAGILKAASQHQRKCYNAGEVESPKSIVKLEGQSCSEEAESSAEAALRCSSKSLRLRKDHQLVIKNSSEVESWSKQNVEDDMFSVSDDADETTSNLSAEPSGKALSSDSEAAGSQARPAKNVVKAASMQRQSSRIANAMSPEGCGKFEGSSSSDEDESAEETVSKRLNRACGERKAQRRRISDSSEDESFSEQSLDGDVHLASDDDVGVPSVMGAESVREVPSSENEGSSSSSVKNRAAAILSSGAGASSFSCKRADKVNKPARSRIRSSSEEESQVKGGSKGSSDLSASKLTKELKTSSGSECESPEENSDDQSSTSPSIRKSVTATSLLASSERAAKSSLNLRKTVSGKSRECRNRIGDLLQQEPGTNQVSKGNNKTSASECTCILEMSSGTESDLPLSQNALSQTVKKVRRNRIVSSSESSDNEHGLEVSVQPDTAGHEVPSESDDDEIPCGQRSPSILSLQRVHLSFPNSESEVGLRSPELQRKCHFAAESDADTVNMLSGDEEVFSRKQSRALFSTATTVPTLPGRHAVSPFSKPRGAEMHHYGDQVEKDADTGANQGSAENSVFKLPTLEKARSAGAHWEAESKSQNGHGGLNKHVAYHSNTYERSEKRKTEHVGTASTRKTLRSLRSESSQDENMAESDRDGVTELGCGDTILSASDGAVAHTSLNCSAPALQEIPRVQSDSISSDPKKTSICEESSNALRPHDVHVDANEGAVRSASQSSLKTEQTVAHEGPQVNSKRRTSSRKCLTSGPSHSEKAMHETSSECDTDVCCSSKEVSEKRVHQYSSMKSPCGVEVSVAHSIELSDDDIELESTPQKHLSPLSNEKCTASVIRLKSDTHSEESGAGKCNNLQKSQSSSGKLDSPAKFVVHTRNSRRQLLANLSASLSPERNEAAKCGRAERAGKARDNLEQASSSSEQGEITDDSSEQESPRKRPCSTSSKKKHTLSKTRDKSGTNLELARTYRSEQLAPNNQKSPFSPAKDDIPAIVMNWSARKRLSTSRAASESPEKDRTAKSTRAGRPDKTTDTLDAALAWEKLRNISEEILDNDAESGRSSVIDHSPSIATALSSVALCKEAILSEELPNEHKVVGQSKRHSTRLRASQTAFSTTPQFRLRSSKSDVEAVVPVASSLESSKVHPDSNAVQNESIARSGAMLEHSRQCSTQDLPQSSSNLSGLTQAPSSLPLCLSADLPSFRREADSSQQSQQGVRQPDKKDCAVNTVETLYSSFCSHGEDKGDETASLAKSSGLSPLSQNKDSPMSPKAVLTYHRGYGPDARKSGRLSLTAIRSSQSEASECSRLSPPVSNGRAGTNRALEQPIISTATRTRQSSSTRGSSPENKKQAGGAKKRPTRVSAPRGSQNNVATEASTSLLRQAVDATGMKGTSAKPPATRRSARLSLMSSNLGSQANSSCLAAVALEEGKASDVEGDGRLTRSRSVRTTPSSKDHSSAQSRMSPVQVILDTLQDISMTKRRTGDTCSACQRSSPATQDNGTMTDESYLQDEADFSDSSMSTKRRKTDRRSVAAASEQKTVTSTHRSHQCSRRSQQPNAPVRRSTRTSVNASRRLSYA